MADLVVIVKYQNRKFYNKATKVYCTLKEIGRMAPGSYVVFNQKSKLNITEEVFFDAMIARARSYNSRTLITGELYKVLNRVTQ